MARSKIHVGIEIGTSKILAVVGEINSDGSIKILGTGETPSRGVRKGEITDFKTVHTCLYDAIFSAEERSDVQIRTVILSVTGGHIQSLNNRGLIELPEDQNEITEEDIEELKRVSREVEIPRENVFIHSALRHYYVDGQERVINPLGRLCNRLEASYHIVHGVKTRISNAITCIKEMTLDVEAVVFAPLASAQIVLNRPAREQGALMIDIGGGTTDYALYRDGVVAQSGCIPVGGDHITNDIAVCFKLPLSKAEKVKITEGCAIPGDPELSETVHLADEPSFTGRHIRREELDLVINARVAETFELLRDRLKKNGGLDRIAGGVWLTGGTSRLHGIDRLAKEIFQMPVQRHEPSHAQGPPTASENPTYSTALGLIRYAQLRDSDLRGSGRFGSLLRNIFSRIR